MVSLDDSIWLHDASDRVIPSLWLRVSFKFVFTCGIWRSINGIRPGDNLPMLGGAFTLFALIVV